MSLPSFSYVFVITAFKRLSKPAPDMLTIQENIFYIPLLTTKNQGTDVMKDGKDYGNSQYKRNSR